MTDTWVMARAAPVTRYGRTKLMYKAAFLEFVVEIQRHSDTARGFEVIPRQWSWN